MSDLDAPAARLREAAERLGVEVDAHEAAAWMAAVEEAQRGGHDLVVDPATGVFGHRIALLDFDPGQLERVIRLGEIVGCAPHAQVDRALAIAGSSAQGRVQLFPGDADFYERIHIRAADEGEARGVLATVMRETALRAFAQPDVVLIEVNFGVYDAPVTERGVARASGDTITWTPADVLAGAMEVLDASGAPTTIAWDDAPSAGAGWTYLGWIVAERDRGAIALASNMFDVTWETPDGEIAALDGSLDPAFQEVYIDPSSLPLVTRLLTHVPPAARPAYLEAMRSQAAHYTTTEPNWGKAAKRLYNLFRLTDELESAAYVRELFDEPRARLYQVPGLLEAATAADAEGSGIERETVLRQVDEVIEAVVAATDGVDEDELVAALRQLRAGIADGGLRGDDERELLHDVRARCSALVSDFFRDRLLAFASIERFIQTLAPGGAVEE